MKKLCLLLLLSTPAYANTLDDYTGSSFGKTQENNISKHYTGVIEVTTPTNRKSYCFIGDSRTPCFFTDGNLIETNKNTRSVLEYDKDINDPNDVAKQAIGYCIEYPDNTLQCSAKTNTDNISIEFLFRK